MFNIHRDRKGPRDQISEYLGCYHHVKRRKAIIAFIEQLTDSVIPCPKILDVGCGDGWYTSFLVESDFVVGIDISIESLKNAKRKAEKADFVLCNANITPFANNVFDLTIAAQFLEHMENPVLTVRNLASLVKNGDFLLFELLSRSNVIDYLFTKLLRKNLNGDLQ